MRERKCRRSRKSKSRSLRGRDRESFPYYSQIQKKTQKKEEKKDAGLVCDTSKKKQKLFFLFISSKFLFAFVY